MDNKKVIKGIQDEKKEIKISISTIFYSLILQKLLILLIIKFYSKNYKTQELIM